MFLTSPTLRLHTLDNKKEAQKIYDKFFFRKIGENLKNEKRIYKVEIEAD